MLEDEEKEDRDEPVIEALTEAEPSTKQLSDILASLANLQEQIETVNFDTRQEALTHIKKLTRLIDEKYSAKIQASQQSLITRYLRRENEERAAVRQVINAIDEDEGSDDDSLLGSLSPIHPKDYSGFESDDEILQEIYRRDGEEGGGGGGGASSQ